LQLFLWVTIFFGKTLGFELQENPSYKFLVLGFGILSNIFVVFHLFTLVGIFIKKYFEYSYAEKEKKEYYLKAIKTIMRYENIDGIGILLSLLAFPSRGNHWQKHVPNEYQKPEVQALLNNFSNIAVNRSGSKNVLFAYKSDILSYYSNQFDFDKGFFEFLEEDYFAKNKHNKVDLTSNFVRLK